MENVHSNRALNREYQEKLVSMTCWRVLRTLFLPAPLRAVYTAWRSLPYIWQGSALYLASEDARWNCWTACPSASPCSGGDFGTAGSVMFLLELGELLEEWTHKKSVDDLARSMSLNIDRVWLKTDGGEVLVPLTQVRAGDAVVRPRGRHDPAGRRRRGGRGHGQSGLPHRRVHPGAQAARAPPSMPAPSWRRANASSRSRQQSGGSRYDKIVAMIEQSEKLKSAAENKAVQSGGQAGALHAGWAAALVYLLTRNVTRALSVLMVDFSCALKLSMPLAVLSAMREASALPCHRQGRQVPGGAWPRRTPSCSTRPAP